LKFLCILDNLFLPIGAASAIFYIEFFRAALSLLEIRAYVHIRMSQIDTQRHTAFTSDLLLDR